MRSLKVDPTQFDVNLVGRFPIGAGFIATHINDDEVCEAVVTATCTQPIVIYVEVNEQPCGDREVNSAVECQPGRNNTEYIRLSGYATREPNYFAGTSSAAMSDPEGDDINPTSLEDVGYETMPSGGSSDDEEENDSDPNETDMRGTELSIRITDLIAGYSSRTSHTEQHMVCNNDYFHSAQTIRDWDEDLTFDGPLNNSVFEDENCIPDGLVEGICFHTKKQLQFAVQGWSIRNNVEYVIYASNKSKFTVMCTHHSLPSRQCLWRLHTSSIKKLGGAWRIGSIGSAHICAHSVINVGHRQCTAAFVSYFIQPTIKVELTADRECTCTCRQPQSLIGKADVAPMDLSFVRVDGRGKTDVDWVVYHHSFIAQWEQRRDSIVTVDSSLQDLEPAINYYMRWYRSWASLYMLKAPTVPPDTYYPRTPWERLMREHILKTEDIFQRYFGRDEDTGYQKSFNDYEELLVDLRQNMHISGTRYRDTDIPGTSTSAQSGVPSMDAGPSSTPVVGQTAYTFSQPPQYSYQEAMWSQMHPWHAAAPSPYGPPSYPMTPPFGVYHGYSLPTQGSTDVPPVMDLGDSQHYVEHVEAEAGHQQHHLRDRSRQPPAHYTPGSDAIPPRRHRRR